MPELPDLTIYLERLEAFLHGRVLLRVRLASPFVLRSVNPPVPETHGRKVTSFGRLGKQLIVELEDEYCFVIHLMIAGRLHWKKPGSAVPRRTGLAGFDFEHGTLLLTEQGTKKRASIYLVKGPDALGAFDRGGLEVMQASPDAFAAALARENHTLKRALTDPRILSGIGNAYSDEILHRARMSPFKPTSKLSAEEMQRLHRATQEILSEWIDRLRTEVGEGFPGKVTAFREEMAVHGRYKKPCPVCQAPVQRIRYAENEANYCARCQTGGRLLSDRSLSRLLKGSWPRTIDELEGR